MTNLLPRVKRTLCLIAANAKQATPGKWYVDRGDVVLALIGLADMRYIATCDPATMSDLAADVSEFLDNPRLLAGHLVSVLPDSPDNTVLIAALHLYLERAYCPRPREEQ